MYIVSALVVWTVFSILWFANSLGRKHKKASYFENIIDHLFSPPILLIATIFGYMMYADHKQDAYWVFAQVVRIMLLPIVIPVRMYELVRKSFKRV